MVEGPTEERFVKDVLNPYFSSHDAYLVSTIVTTKVVKSGSNYKGGWTSYGPVRRDLFKLLADSSASLVTTMFDYYGLPRDFPSGASSNGSCYDKVAAAERVFYEDIGNTKFIPYLQLHEFEGLLFTSPKIIAESLVEPGKESKLQRIRNEFKSPEEINQGPETHPSMRLKKIFPNYEKPLYGTLIANRTGVAALRASCPHFNDWVGRLIAAC